MYRDPAGRHACSATCAAEAQEKSEAKKKRDQRHQSDAEQQQQLDAPRAGEQAGSPSSEQDAPQQGEQAGSPSSAPANEGQQLQTAGAETNRSKKKARDNRPRKEEEAEGPRGLAAEEQGSR